MKVLSLSTSDLIGGAPRAAYRLHQGLIAAGVDAQMLVQRKMSDNPQVIGATNKLLKGLAITRPTLDALPLLFYPQRDRTPNIYSCQWLPSRINAQIQTLNPDLIHLHWICGGYFPVETMAKFNRPLVWTLHDMWPFTGGCHYSQQCDRYQQSCGQCPLLKSPKGLAAVFGTESSDPKRALASRHDRTWDFSRWLWQRKAKAWQNLNLTIVTPSKWLASCAKASSLFQNLTIKVIPNGLDIHKYQPIDQQLAKKLLNLPLNKQIILFGAMGGTSDPRKGFQLLQTALQHLKLSISPERVELLVYGSSQPAESVDLGFKTHYLGYLHDDISLAIAYAAAQVMVVPSTQEAFGQTASEALACGTPVVAFNTTGLKDIIDSQQNGYLATAFDPQDLARGIAWILESPQRWQQLSESARAKVIQEFTIPIQSDRYRQLFQEILVEQNAT
ncbi:MAG: glycosyltransferase family 4 protein [Pleurocapsa sp.]